MPGALVEGRGRGRSAIGGRVVQSGAADVNETAGWLFVLPVTGLFLAFRIAPTIGAFGLSLSSYQLGGAIQWAGVTNYARLISDPAFWQSLRVTVVYCVIGTPLLILVALGCATLLNSIGRGGWIFRALLFLPYVTNLVLASIIWRWIYAADATGLLNSVLRVFHIPPLDLLNNATSVLPAIAVMATWQSYGYAMMVLFAGLRNIPGEYLEAAGIDGARTMSAFRHITLPLLRPTLLFVLMITTVGAIQVFDPVYVMTSGGPAGASTSLVFMLYNQGFQAFDYSYTAVIGVVVFIMCIGVSLVQWRMMRSGVER